MTQRTPLLFIGHGNPINAIEDNQYSLGWEKIGKEITAPKAVVCMSAHWLTKGSFITSNLKPEMIYDFYGFPEKLYHVQYPVVGSPKLAKEMSKECPQIEHDTQWGIDHGAWSVLRRIFPKANIPVLQLSIDYAEKPEAQFELMTVLKKLREKDILFIGSGNIVHNLGMAALQQQPYDWALEFESESKQLIEKGDTTSLLHYEKLGKAAQLSVPTNDHYRPMLNTLALRFPDEKPIFFNQGIDLSSVSMLSVLFR